MELVRIAGIIPAFIFFCFMTAAGSPSLKDRIGTDSLRSDFETVGDSLVQVARSYLGTPYKYGSRGPDTFDCSGFTLFIFTNFDIPLPATSRTQIHAGREVALDSVRQGDLIFLTSPGSRNRPGHVGIITRNDEEGIFFVHSSSMRGVVEDRLNSYYQKKLIAFRRVLED